MAAPQWVQKNSFEDGLNYYFVEKVQADREDCKQCIEEARRAALIEMVRAHFDTQQNISITSIEKLSGADYQIYATEKLPLLQNLSFREKERRHIS